MINFRTVAVAASLLAVPCVFAQAGFVGTWNGKISIDASGMQKPKDPKMAQQMQKQLDMAKNMVAKAVMHLTIKPDKTFTVKGEGMPGTPAMDASGTYVVNGSTIVLTTKMSQGKPSKSKQPLTLKLVGGKLVSSQTQAGMKINMVFTH